MSKYFIGDRIRILAAWHGCRGKVCRITKVQTCWLEVDCCDLMYFHSVLYDQTEVEEVPYNGLEIMLRESFDDV